MTRLAVLLLILLMASPVSAATFLWPWQYRKHHHGQQRRAVDPMPDCEQIREAVSTLTPGNLERVLRSLNAKQRNTIARCRAAQK